MKLLIIQTAFIGDVILATPIIEKVNSFFTEPKIDFLLRKGNEGLLKSHPKINKILIWDKQKNKQKNLFTILNTIRNEDYDYVINLQRFWSTGLLTAFSKGKTIIGLKKNPLSFLFHQKIEHKIEKGIHEINRNLYLIESITDNKIASPKLYPTQEDFNFVEKYKNEPYICIAPTSVWFTKQFPEKKWIELIKRLNRKIYLIGGNKDYEKCTQIIAKSITKIENLCGKLTLLQSAALMKDAEMNYVNDSAPMHIASAMNAPITAIYCSTIPEFGFGPLSTHSKVVQTKEQLDCKPCGLHGLKDCPKGHFKCADTIDVNEIIK